MNKFLKFLGVIVTLALGACQNSPAAPVSNVSEAGTADVQTRKFCALISPLDGHRVACLTKDQLQTMSCQAAADLGGHVGVPVKRCTERPAEFVDEPALDPVTEPEALPPTTSGCACAQYQATACMVWVWGQAKTIAWTEDGARGCSQQVCNELVAEFKVGLTCPAPRYLDPLELSNLAPTD